jgi:hypothetical protein
MVSLHSLLSNGWVETKEGAKTRKCSGTLAANTINKPTLQINKCELPIDKRGLPINCEEPTDGSFGGTERGLKATESR